MDKNGLELMLQSKAIRFSRRHFEKITLSGEGMSDAKELLTPLGDAIKEIGADADTILQVEVTGNVPPSFRIHPQTFAKLADKLCYLTLEDHTVMLCDGAKENKDLKSVFAQKTAEKTEDPLLRSKILKCGFEALEKGRQQDRK